MMGTVRRILSAFAAAAIALAATATLDAASSRERATARFKWAAQLRADLRQVPPLELGVQQYELVIAAFEAVHRTDPGSGYCDDALVAAAELYAQMAERFGDDKYRQKAVATYRFAAREYPASKHRGPALAMAERLAAGSDGAAQPAQAAGIVAASASAAPAIAALSDEIHAAGEIVKPSAPSDQGVALISRIRHHSYEDGTRVVLDIGGRTPLKFDRLSNPDRLYIDLFESSLEKAIIDGVTVEVSDPLITAARLGQNRRSKARLVLDLKTSIAFDAFWIDGPTRFVLDLRPAGTPKADRTLQALHPSSQGGPTAAVLPPPRAAEATADGKLNLTRALGLKSRKILVDAGHGGHDTGTVGSSGLREKDVVLDIANRLASLLGERLGAEVIKTRDSDVFVDLEERARIANEAGADLMVSIHCNSAAATGVRGIETYYLGLTSDARALEVAAQENATANLGIHELQGLVAKITRGDHATESKEFATRIQSSLHRGVSKHSSSIRDRGIRKAPFVVLTKAEIPAALVEVGFMSNKADEALLGKPAFRQEVAEHLFAGIADYARGLGTVTMQSSLSAGSSQRD